MPELPEVEHVVRGLAPIIGRRILSLELGEHHPPPSTLASQIGALAGAHIAGVRRRGKWIVIDTDHSTSLVVHLRMTGSLLLASTGQRRRWTLHMEGQDVTLVDPRSFGTLQVLAQSELDAFFGSRLGREPIDARFDGRYLASALAKRHGAIKPALLDQKIAAGAGNIYVDEALWSAQVHPLARASALPLTVLQRLAEALVEAVRGGIERGGSSVRDYFHADGTVGSNQHFLAAYGRAGMPCLRCGTTLAHGKVSGRGSVWCPVCQKTPPDAVDAAMMGL